ncbi:CBS domain-containing protein [Acidocella sp.]|jgi:CBS domain-containing protein|uniref:CBS domain-containing protein n=1 Tax=Acidocella sp. TaxID=50710 RepID=UPI002F40DDC6
MNVAALMSTNIVSVLPSTTLADAVRIMLAHNVSGLPVLETDGTLVGMITEGDLLRRTELESEGKQPSWLKVFLMPSSVAADYVATHGRRVCEVMTPHPMHVGPAADLAEVSRLMLHKHVKRLPVLEADRLVGIISRSDVLRALARKLIEVPEERTDEEIRTYIKNEIAHAKWAPKSSIKIEVKEKVVNLEGTIFSDEERQAVIVIAENAPGVKIVQDHLTYVDPGSGMSFPMA